MKRCINCGYEHNERGKYCRHCLRQIKENKTEYYWWRDHDISQEASREKVKPDKRVVPAVVPE